MAPRLGAGLLALGLLLAPGLGLARVERDQEARAEARVLRASGEVEVAFSPHNDPEAMILRHLAAAREAIYVQAYVFTSRNVARALVAARERGVKVEVLADAKMNARGNPALEQLLEGGVPLAFETRYAAAHNKVIIVDPGQDACAVLTGSYNFTWSAREKNAENLLALRGNRALAKTYLDNWRAHRAEASEVRRLPWKS